MFLMKSSIYVYQENLFPRLEVLDGSNGDLFQDLWLYFYWAQLLVSAKIDCHLDHLKIH